MNVKDEIAKEEDEISLQDEDDKPLTQDDFNKICQIKYAINKKEAKKWEGPTKEQEKINGWGDRGSR